MKNLNKSFMAVKVGKESVEGVFKMYKGIQYCSCKSY